MPRTWVSMDPVIPRVGWDVLNTVLPDFRVRNVDQISLERLRALGVRAIAFDVDSTLVEPDQIEIRPADFQFLESIDMPIYLTTNRRAPRGEDLAQLIGAHGVVHASTSFRKPQAEYFRQVASVSVVPLEEMAMVGDRLLTDIIGGNRAGMTTVFVEALGRDPAYIRWTGLRKIETVLMTLLAK